MALRPEVPARGVGHVLGPWLSGADLALAMVKTPGAAAAAAIAAAAVGSTEARSLGLCRLRGSLRPCAACAAAPAVLRGAGAPLCRLDAGASTSGTTLAHSRFHANRPRSGSPETARLNTSPLSSAPPPYSPPCSRTTTWL